MGIPSKPADFLMLRTPHPKNAPGPFYVEDGGCVACEAPERSCPDVMGHEADSDGSRYHCFFKKQPATQDELEQALDACKLCCSGAVRYAGNDPHVLERLANYVIHHKSFSSADSCDALSGLNPSQVRRSVDLIVRRETATGDPMWDREQDG